MKRQKKLSKQVKSRSCSQTNSYRSIKTEIVLKLIVSWVIIVIIGKPAFRKLLPYHFSQKAKLEELKIQVQETDARVTKLKEELNHNFDPQQTQSLMEQYSSLTAPNQSRIYWLKDKKESQEPSE